MATARSCLEEDYSWPPLFLYNNWKRPLHLRRTIPDFQSYERSQSSVRFTVFASLYRLLRRAESAGSARLALESMPENQIRRGLLHDPQRGRHSQFLQFYILICVCTTHCSRLQLLLSLLSSRSEHRPR